MYNSLYIDKPAACFSLRIAKMLRLLRLSAIAEAGGGGEAFELSKFCLEYIILVLLHGTQEMVPRQKAFENEHQ